MTNDFVFFPKSFLKLGVEGKKGGRKDEVVFVRGCMIATLFAH